MADPLAVQTLYALGGTAGTATVATPILERSTNGGATWAGLVNDLPATPTTEMSDNALGLACANNLTSFQPPSGVFLSYFCTADGVASTGNPATVEIPARVSPSDITDAICTAMYGWISSGGATTLGTTTIATMPPCPIH